MSFTKLDYCQYLLSSPINYTITNLADHLESITHDSINRYLRRQKLTPRLLWENVKPSVQPDPNGYLLFDDTVLDKRYSGGQQPYQQVDQLHWNEETLEQGKSINIRGFPRDKKVKLFQVTVSSRKTEFVATNDLTQDSTDAAQQESGIRWKIEEFHRELKQLTGIEACQCRKARIQRNHIACALLV